MEDEDYRNITNKDFKVSFKKSEIELKKQIVKESKVIGISSWFKLAAIEKLARDTKEESNSNFNVTKPVTTNDKPITSKLESDSTFVDFDDLVL